MTDQQSTHAATSNAVKTYYSKRILKDFEKNTKFYQLAPVKEPIPMGSGKTIEFTRYRKIAGLRADNTNEFTAQQIYLSASIVQATLHARDGYVQLSRQAVLTSINNILDRAAEKVKNSAAQTVDILVRNDIGIIVADVANASSLNMQNMAIDGGTLNSTGITARVWSHERSAANDRFPVYHNKTRIAQSATVVSFAKSAMTVKTLQSAAQVLVGKDVDQLNGSYHAIMHSYTAYQLTTTAGFKGWHSPTTTAPVSKLPTEATTEIAGIKIHVTNNAYCFPLSGDTMSTASGNLYATLIFGDEAYGVSEISGNGSGFKFYLKESGPQSTNDPTDMIKQAAYSVFMVGKVLNKSAGLWVLTTQFS